MPKTSVLKAKIILPDIPYGAFYSERIQKLNIPEHKSVIITAPAGFGKTTAVLLSLQCYRDNTHWYRLEKEDSALSLFFAHLIVTLFRESSTLTETHRSLASIGNINTEYSLLCAVTCQDAWLLYGNNEVPHYLVFDDFQNVFSNTVISEIIKYFISNMPPNVHIIVISRKETGIKTEKLSLTNETAFIDGKNLLFSKNEIETLLNESKASDLSSKFADDIYDYTEGWIAGVALMKHTLENHKHVDTKSILKNRESIFEYLLGEVLAGADHDKVMSAAIISLLEDFNSDDLTGIFHFNAPDELIEWLEDSNFYIYKVNAVPVCYRFHSLFRDALLQILKNKHSDSDIVGFHLSAAVYYEKSDRCKLAVNHYLAASDVNNAVRLASEKGLFFMDNGYVEAAAELVHQMPENLIVSNARLSIINACILSGTETERGFSYLVNAIKMAVKNDDLNAAIKAQGFAISLCIQQSNFQAIKGVVDLVPMAKAMRISKQVRKMMIHSLFLKFTTSFKVKPAIILSYLVDKVKMDDKEGLWQFSSLLTKGFLYGVMGDFNNAKYLVQDLTEHPVALRNDRWAAFGLQVSCHLLSCMGEKELLAQLADKMTSIGIKYSDSFASADGALNTANAKYQNRDIQAAVFFAEKAEKLYIGCHNLLMAIFINIMGLFWKAELYPEKKFAKQMEELVAALLAAGDSDRFLMIAKIATAALYLREDDFTKAEELLFQVWKWAKKVQAIQIKCCAAIYLSILYNKKQDLRKEEIYLMFFSKTASRMGYIYFHAVSYSALIFACARSVIKNLAPGYMVNLIGRYFGFEAAAELLKNPSGISKKTEAFILKYLPNLKHESHNVKVKLFGSFDLIIDDKNIDSKVFVTRKIRGIFRFILANPGKTFSRELLAAIFWPDTGEKVASNSLQAALYELRKAMASLNMAFDSENALIAEDTNGLYVYNPDNIESDAARFVLLNNQLLSESINKDDKKAILFEITNLYDGDYLEDVTCDEINAERQQYKTIFFGAAHNLIEIYLREGHVDIAEVLMLKLLRMEDAGLTPEETQVALLLIEGNTRSDILRKLRLTAQEVGKHEKSIRRKIFKMSDMDSALAGIANKYKLTKRETDMLRCLRRGMDNEQIAAELFLSEETVKIHIKNLIKKLPIKKRLDVSQWVDSFDN